MRKSVLISVLIAVLFLTLFPSQIQGSFNFPPPPIITPSTAPEPTNTFYWSPTVSTSPTSPGSPSTIKQDSVSPTVPPSFSIPPPITQPSVPVSVPPFLNHKSIPTISKISASKANQGDRVTLTGLNFNSDTKVYVGDALMPQQFYSLSEDGRSLSFILSTETPFKINQKYDVYVSNGNDQSNKTALTVTSPAVLRFSNPTNANFGQIVQLTGSGFGSSTGSVIFISPNGSFAGGAPILFWNDKHILFRVPAVAGNTPYQLQVNMGNQPEGKIAYSSNTIPFTVRSGQPYVASITPSNAKPGKVVTIEGTELGTKPGRVKFIASANKIIPTTIYFWSEMKVQFMIPRVISDLDYGVQITTVDGRESSVTFYYVGK